MFGDGIVLDILSSLHVSVSVMCVALRDVRYLMSISATTRMRCCDAPYEISKLLFPGSIVPTGSIRSRLSVLML